MKSYYLPQKWFVLVCNTNLSMMSYWPVVFPVICFQARELQTLHNLRKLFVQDLTTRVKKVRIYSFEPKSVFFFFLARSFDLLESTSAYWYELGFFFQ